jgi:hypothetical protein
LKLGEYKIIKTDDEGIVMDEESLDIMREDIEGKGISTAKFHAEMAGERIQYL